MLDTLLHEYGWTEEYALSRRLARACAYYAAISARYGHEASGPDFEEQDMLAEIDRERAAGTEGKDLPWAG